MTDDRFDPFNPSDPPRGWDPLVIAQWAGLGRALIAALAGAGILGAVWSSVSAEQIANLLTAFLTVGGVALGAWSAFWSWRQKRAEAKAKREAEVAAAVASAERTAKATQEAGRPVLVPVTVTVTPEGQENMAVRVSPAEAAVAESVPIGKPVSLAPASGG